MAPDQSTSAPAQEALGPNAWLVDEMYEQFRNDPSSVSESWREFFADYQRDTDASGNGPDVALPATGRAGDTGQVPVVRADQPPPPAARADGAAATATAPPAAKAPA